MSQIPNHLQAALIDTGQEHVMAWLAKLPVDEKHNLLGQLQSIDLHELQRLQNQQQSTQAHSHPTDLQPITAVTLDPSDRKLRECGEDALRRGEVAALVVAGGQGTRLGFDGPKGTFPIGPVSGNSLFQIFAEKVLAIQRRYQSSLPLLVMTSPATDDATRTFFENHSYFGLPADHMHIFCQGTMPAVDLSTGKLLREAPDRLCLSPNGHGGVLPALRDSGMFDTLCKLGIHHLFYFQVDNPLVKIADPLFLGHHIRRSAEVSTKVLPKKHSDDKVGNLAQRNGRCTIVEYSDLPVELAEAVDAQGKLRFAWGNTGTHIFDVAFLRRMADDPGALPFHIAQKIVPHLNDAGQWVEPEEENAVKFEMFIFDILPKAERWNVVAIEPADEFVPLKNKEGDTSPESVRKAISRQARAWLANAGAKIESDPGSPLMEISPIFALDQIELQRKLHAGATFYGPTYLAASEAEKA